MSSFQHDLVVVPIDFSPSSENALRVALELTGDARKLRLLHVLPPLETISPAAVWGELTDDDREVSVRKFAETFLAMVGLAGAPLEVRLGTPGHEITEFAREQQADLIVVSSHGYHGFKRILLGSVAESILRHAPCAVLVLRRQDLE
jgi:nucleotide-binding universal stress UspA family protein